MGIILVQSQPFLVRRLGKLLSAAAWNIINNNLSFWMNFLKIQDITKIY